MSYPPSFYGYAPQIDPDIHDFVVTEHPHTKVHQSKAFNTSSIATVTAGNTFVEQLLTAVGIEDHTVFSIVVSGNGVTVELLEAPTTSDGTPISAICRNRQDVKIAATVCSTGVTISNAGLLLYTSHLPAGGNTSFVDRSTAEFILKPSTKYVLRITVDAGSAATISCSIDWYEVPE